MARSYFLEALRSAYGWGAQKDWPAALRLLERAAREGEPGARRQHDILTQKPLRDLLEPPVPERLSGAARLAVARGFALPGFGDWLMDRAEAKLQPATTGGGIVDSQRTAMTAFFRPLQSDLVLAALQHRASVLLGVPVECHEAPSVIRYQAGQSYVPHFDFLDPAVERERKEIGTNGQRVATVVTYLNADFEGASTDFPKLGISFRGEPGDAIFFANVLTNGQPDPLTLHSAPAPTSGTKWVLSQWVRAKKLNLAKELSST
jgi:prolyl 4-hydroxylase